MKDPDPKDTSSEGLLKRLKVKAARGSIERNTIAVRLFSLKDRGQITQEQVNDVLGIATS
ncbi:MAG: hypothetical protein AAB470_02985 [Patescibacteria group bacterium]